MVHWYNYKNEQKIGWKGCGRFYTKAVGWCCMDWLEGWVVELNI